MDGVTPDTKHHSANKTAAVGSRITKNTEFNDRIAQMIGLKAAIGYIVANF